MRTFTVILLAAVAILQVVCGASAEDAAENSVSDNSDSGNETTNNQTDKKEQEEKEEENKDEEKKEGEENQLTTQNNSDQNENQIQETEKEEKEVKEEEKSSDGDNSSNDIEPTIVSTSLPLLYKNALEYFPPIPNRHKYDSSKYFGGPNEVTYGKFSSPPGNAWGRDILSKLPWRRGHGFGSRTPYYGCSCCSPKQSQYLQSNDYQEEPENRESSQYSPYSQYSQYKPYHWK